MVTFTVLTIKIYHADNTGTIYRIIPGSLI